MRHVKSEKYRAPKENPKKPRHKALDPYNRKERKAKNNYQD